MDEQAFPQLLIDELEALKAGVESSERRLSVEEIVAKINGLIQAIKLDQADRIEAERVDLPAEDTPDVEEIVDDIPSRPARRR